MGDCGFSSRGQARHQLSFERSTMPGKAGTGLHGHSSAVPKIAGKPGAALEQCMQHLPFEGSFWPVAMAESLLDNLLL